MNVHMRPTRYEPIRYRAVLTHVRRERVERSFRHPLTTWLVDLDHVPPPRPLRSFRAADHLGSPELSIRDNLTRWLAAQGVDLGGGRVLMLTTPRSLGHAFNPLTVYWCHDAAGEQVCVVAEVHNTYGERHCYLLRPDSDGRAETPKTFYVSPFFTVDGDYTMRLPAPGERLALRITLRRAGRDVFAAVLTGTRSAPAPWWVRLRELAGPYRVSALIRRHGIAVWARRIPVVARPARLPQEGVQ